MAEIDRSDFDGVAQSLTAAWNAADGHAFAQAFAADADFVNIYAMHVAGRDAIAKQHQMIFDTVYKGSRNEFTVVKARPFDDATVLVHIESRLRVPGGPMAGDMRTLATTVFVRDRSGWQIASFHNTREQPPPQPAVA